MCRRSCHYVAAGNAAPQIGPAFSSPRPAWPTEGVAATAQLSRILFVDDEPRILDGLQALLRRYRKKWDMHFACGGQAGLDALATAPFDVVVSDIRMPHMDGAEFLTRVQAQYPGVVRIVLSGQTEPHVSKRLVNIAHQFLAKPCDAEKLCEVIEGTMAIRGLLHHPELRELTNSLGHLPSAPLTYQRVVRLLQSDRGDLADLADLLQEDVALAAKVLQVVNSAFFGLPQKDLGGDAGGFLSWYRDGQGPGLVSRGRRHPWRDSSGARP